MRKSEELGIEGTSAETGQPKNPTDIFLPKTKVGPDSDSDSRLREPEV